MDKETQAWLHLRSQMMVEATAMHQTCTKQTGTDLPEPIRVLPPCRVAWCPCDAVTNTQLSWSRPTTNFKSIQLLLLRDHWLDAAIWRNRKDLTELILHCALPCICGNSLLCSSIQLTDNWWMHKNCLQWNAVHILSLFIKPFQIWDPSCHQSVHNIHSKII